MKLKTIIKFAVALMLFLMVDFAIWYNSYNFQPTDTFRPENTPHLVETDTPDFDYVYAHPQ